MKLFNLSLQGMVIRFYLMMAVVLVAGFTGIWAIAILALPIFISGMVGMSLFTAKKKTSTIATPSAKVIKPKAVNLSGIATA